MVCCLKGGNNRKSEVSQTTPLTAGNGSQKDENDSGISGISSESRREHKSGKSSSSKKADKKAKSGGTSAFSPEGAGAKPRKRRSRNVDLYGPGAVYGSQELSQDGSGGADGSNGDGIASLDKFASLRTTGDLDIGDEETVPRPLAIDSKIKFPNLTQCPCPPSQSGPQAPQAEQVLPSMATRENLSKLCRSESAPSPTIRDIGGSVGSPLSRSPASLGGGSADKNPTKRGVSFPSVSDRIGTLENASGNIPQVHRDTPSTSSSTASPHNAGVSSPASQRSIPQIDGPSLSSESQGSPGKRLTSISSTVEQMVKEEVLPKVEEAPKEDILGPYDNDPEMKALFHQAYDEISSIPDWKVYFETKDPEFSNQLKVSFNDDGYGGDMFFASIMPYPMVQCMAPVMEVETWTKWHPLCIKHERQGPPEAFRLNSHYEQGFPFGMFKSDQNTRTTRWVCKSQGFYLQSLRTLQEGEEGYVKPRLNRDKLSGTILVIARSPTSTIVVQRFNFFCPIKIPSMLQNTFLNRMAPSIAKTLFDNARDANDPKGPFKKYIDEDITGLYGMLRSISEVPGPRPDELIARTLAIWDIPSLLPKKSKKLGSRRLSRTLSKSNSKFLKKFGSKRLSKKV